MSWFKNLGTVVKLVLAFGLMAALTAVVGYKGLGAAGDIDAMLNSMYDKELVGIVEIQKANILRVTISRDTRSAMMPRDGPEVCARVCRRRCPIWV